MLLTGQEVAPWVETVIRLWDDPEFSAEHQRRAVAEARRWSPEVLEPQYLELFDKLTSRRPFTQAGVQGSPAQSQAQWQNEDAVTKLGRAYPWPAERPDIQVPVESPGWLGEGADLLLTRELSGQTRLVVELGAWLGKSTRFIADHAPNAIVISVDHWQGSAEHRDHPQLRALLPGLYETYLALCWPYRDRVIPLRMTTLDGLRTIAEHGLSPDLIYIDAEHSFEAVTAELDLAHELFPRARLIGDDYDWLGVRQAVDAFARQHGMTVEQVGIRGWKLVADAPLNVRQVLAPKRTRAVVLVPHLNGIEPECEDSLRRLEQAGVRVVRRRGSSQIDVARNDMASDALHDGFESLLFIDADLGFDPLDALRLLARPEPVLSGVYAKKGRREMASVFADGITEIRFGALAPGPYPLKYAATGFLRIQAAVLRLMIEKLALPLCNRKWGRGTWPFFQPLVAPHPECQWHYLGEDWAFSHRLTAIGVTPLADTSIRLWHYGSYGYGWEDAGADPTRYRDYTFRP